MKTEEFKKVLGYILAESDIKDTEVTVTSIAPTVRENVKTYHVSDGEYIDFFAQIAINDKKWGSGEHLAVVNCYGDTADDCISVYRVEDGYLYDVIYVTRADK